MRNVSKWKGKNIRYFEIENTQSERPLHVQTERRLNIQTEELLCIAVLRLGCLAFLFWACSSPSIQVVSSMCMFKLKNIYLSKPTISKYSNQRTGNSTGCCSINSERWQKSLRTFVEQVRLQSNPNVVMRRCYEQLNPFSIHVATLHMEESITPQSKIGYSTQWHTDQTVTSKSHLATVDVFAKMQTCIARKISPGNYVHMCLIHI